MTENRNKFPGKFFEGQHLNEEGIALSAEALFLDKVYLLPEAISSHLEECADCKRQVLDVSAYLQESGFEADPGQHPYFSKGVHNLYPDVPGRSRTGKSGRLLFFIKLAGAAVFLLLLAFLLWNVYDRDPKKPELAGTERNLGKEGTANVEYAPHPLLESLLRYTYRSESGLAVIFPDTGAVFSNGEIISFKWNRGTIDTLELAITDNKGYEMFNTVTASDSLGVDHPLPAGLYYWKLSWRGEMCYLGKFYVR